MGAFRSRKLRSGVVAAQYTHSRFKPKRMVHLDHLERRFAQMLVTRIGQGGTIIDVPCGDGRFSSILGQANLLASADYDPDMVLATQVKHENLVLGRLLIADITSLPFASDSADLTFSMRLLHHIPESKTRIAVLKELARVSRTWVAVSFYRKECLRYIRKRALRKKISGHPIWVKSFCDEAAQCKLELIEKTPRFFGLNSQTLVLFRKKN